MILVVGCRGMLGKDLMDEFSGTVRGVDVEEMDITSPEAVRRTILALRPTAVINAAAYTDVDGCESREELAMEVNGAAVRNLAEACRESGACLVQVSTDYVFDGSKGTPYREEDPVRPLSVYGRSKLAGEENARITPHHLVVRTQWLFGLHGRNFVETMLKLGKEKDEIAVVDDQVGSPTWTRDLARALRALVEKECRGTYHAVNAGSCSWNAFAREIFRRAGMSVNVTSMTTEELGRPARRPLCSVLDTSRLSRDTGLVLPTWDRALGEYLELRSGNAA